MSEGKDRKEKGRKKRGRKRKWKGGRKFVVVGKIFIKLLNKKYVVFFK